MYPIHQSIRESCSRLGLRSIDCMRHSNQYTTIESRKASLIGPMRVARLTVESPFFASGRQIVVMAVWLLSHSVNVNHSLRLINDLQPSKKQILGCYFLSCSLRSCLSSAVLVHSNSEMWMQLLGSRLDRVCLLVLSIFLGMQSYCSQDWIEMTNSLCFMTLLLSLGIQRIKCKTEWWTHPLIKCMACRYISGRLAMDFNVIFLL